MAVYSLDETHLVAACDGVGGIGHKPADAIPIPPFEVGYFCAKVCVAELWAVPASPVLVTATCSTELEPTGRMLTNGVMSLLEEAGLIGEVGFTASSETNVDTNATGVGVTIIGTSTRLPSFGAGIQPGDSVFHLGVPRVGLRIGDADLFPLDAFRTIRALPTVRLVMPLGSGGASVELHALEDAGVSLLLRDDAEELVRQSAGPANTAVVVVGNQTEFLNHILRYPDFVSNSAVEIAAVVAGPPISI